MDYIDISILIAFLCISLGIGLYHARVGASGVNPGTSGQNGSCSTTSGFMMGNRQLSPIPTMLSMLVSFQSAIFILGFVAEMYKLVGNEMVCE